MDELLKVFLSWQFLIFTLGIAGATFVLRKVFEYVMKKYPKFANGPDSLIWRSVLLPIAPLFNGAIAGYFAKMYPYPEGIANSVYGRISFGVVAGLLSGLVYKVVTDLLRTKISEQSAVVLQSVEDSIKEQVSSGPPTDIPPPV